MTPPTKLEREYAEALAKLRKPDAIEGIQTGNSDLTSERGDGPNPDGANTTPGHEHDAAIRGQDWRDR